MPEENAREALRAALARAIGDEHAAVLMERIPPVTWDELARRDDVVALQSDVSALKTDVSALKTDVSELRTEVVRMRPELISEFRQQIIEQNRLLFFSMTGVIFTSASLAFAAVRF